MIAIWIILSCLIQAVFTGSTVHLSDKENTAPTQELAKMDGYNCDVHNVTTEDGYILMLHRISSPKTPLDHGKRPVLIQHGILLSSVSWIYIGPNGSIAYLLADQGYDVWLGNARGTYYSRRHVNLSSSDLQFWDFSWHEMGYYDLPAVIDHILNVTGHKQILYVGHSMGTTMFYVMCTTRPEYNAKVHYMMSLAPIAFLKFSTSAIRLLVPFSGAIAAFLFTFSHGQFNIDTPVINEYFKLTCEQSHFEEKICSSLLFLAFGVDPSQFDEKLLTKIIGHDQDGASTKTLLHYAQLYKSGSLKDFAGRFQQYDYGFLKNVWIYNSHIPPEYNLSRITVPMTLWYGKTDMLGDFLDVKHLSRKLKNKFILKEVDQKLFNHLDFVFGKNVKEVLYTHIIDKFNSI